jgi:hypothetical protein
MAGYGLSSRSMPYNGHELSRRVRSKGFVEDTSDRRQVTRAAGIRDPKGT